MEYQFNESNFISVTLCYFPLYCTRKYSIHGHRKACSKYPALFGGTENSRQYGVLTPGAISPSFQSVWWVSKPYLPALLLHGCLTVVCVKCDAWLFFKAEISFASDTGKLDRKHTKCSKQFSAKISRRSVIPNSNLTNLRPKIASVHAIPPKAGQPETYRMFATPTRPTKRLGLFRMEHASQTTDDRIWLLIHTLKKYLQAKLTHIFTMKCAD